MKYTVVFVFQNTSKYAYVCYYRIYEEIRSYLVSGLRIMAVIKQLQPVTNRFLDIYTEKPNQELVFLSGPRLSFS